MNILRLLWVEWKGFPMFSPKLRRFVALTAFVFLVILAVGLSQLGTPKNACPLPSAGFQVSADGMVASYVSFVRIGAPTGTWALTVLDFEASQMHMLATYSQSPKTALSPSGRMVAAGLERQLDILTLTDGSRQTISVPAAVYALLWLPSEQSLVVQTNSPDLTQLWLVGLDGSLSLLFERAEVSWAVRLVGISPDGTRVALTMENVAGYGPDLYELNLTDGTVRFLLPLGTYWYPSVEWSQDGRYLLLKGSVAPGGFMFLVHDTTTYQTMTSGDISLSASDAAWMTPTQVVYSRYQKNGPSLWIWDVQAHSRRQLVQLGSVGNLRLFPYPGGIGTYSASSTPWSIMAFDDGGQIGGSRQLNISGDVCR